MEIIASTGGKGGTGKSTFAILLAFKLSKNKKVVLCDCDVECPNDHLLLNQELKKPEFIYQEYPVLDKKKCMKCGLCSRTCKEHAIFWIKNNYPVFLHDLCNACGACIVACPYNAIKTKKEKSGEIFINKIKKNLWLITGRSRPGVTETGPIVFEVKRMAIKFAEKKNTDFLIIDTAPGTHCNVIQALLNVEKAYAVTEPTPLGAHDLSLILELTKKLGINTEIVLNRADIGRKEAIEKIARKFNTRISIQIPYSEELLRAYCEKCLEKVVDLV